ncbi:MAG TPA: protoporphyrinogen oxidase [Acidimicrobiia bacterium]|nr:protoporphyrinogen oxidase [Acidimicrobiia bacterium]
MIVVGGGLAGLFTASELFAAGVDVILLEASSHPGGVARTVERNGFSLEPGAGSFTLPHQSLDVILERAGVGSQPALGSSTRYVFTDGRLVDLRPAPRALLAPILPLSAKLRALGEPLVPARAGGEETLASFCRRRFGARAGEMLAWLMASGVYAGDPERLAVTTAFPMLEVLERESGSVIKGALQRRRARARGGQRPQSHVPVGGMASMAAAIAGTLGERFQPDFAVSSVSREVSGWVVSGPEGLSADRVVLAVGPDRAAAMVDEELAGHLTGMPVSPVVVAGLGGHGAFPGPPGFGVLVGPRSGMVTRGVLFESAYAPERSPEGSWLLKVIAGGTTTNDLAQWSDERLGSVLIAETGSILGTDLTVTFLELVRHRRGIPQYELGHDRRLRDIDRLLDERPGLHLAGWGYRGVGVASLAMEATTLAREITR